MGDVVLTSAVTRDIGNVVFVTSEKYAGLVSRFPGVVEVVALKAGEGVGALARRIPDVDRCVDLHGSLRSRLLCGRLGLPTRRLERLHFARFARVAWKRPNAVPLLVQRYAAAAETRVAPHPWISLSRSGGALGVVPSAAHATKRWPVTRWAALARHWPGDVIALGGEGSESLHRDIESEAGRRIESVSESGFHGTFEALGRCEVVVGGDTGLTHLAAACGLPVVGIFGPTTSADGFWCHPGEVVERSDIFCRPCSRHGGEECPFSDHACIREIEEGDVWAVLRGMDMISQGLDREARGGD